VGEVSDRLLSVSAGKLQLACPLGEVALMGLPATSCP